MVKANRGSDPDSLRPCHPLDQYPVWESPSPGITYRVTLNEYGGETLDGLTLYGPITSKRLRSLDLRSLKHRQISSNMQMWPNRETPPTEEELREAWSDDTPVAVTTGISAKVAAKVDEMAKLRLQRRDGQSRDQYAREFAEVYSIMARRDGKPLAHIVAITGMPYSTAAMWAREARAAGHLPPTKRGAAAPA